MANVLKYWDNGVLKPVGGQQGGGGTPVPGSDGGYYSPAVSQPNPNTATFVFTPSKGNMPEVPPQSVELPPGPPGPVQLMAPLTFTGAVSAEYDGTKPVEVPIPAGGGGDKWELIAERTIDKEVDEFAEGSLNCKKIFVEGTCVGATENSGTTNAYVEVDGFTYFYCPSVAPPNGVTRFFTTFVEVLDNDGARRHLSTNNNLNTYQSNGNPVGGSFHTKSKTNINDFHIRTAPKKMGVGTVIRIWGVKA